jgi:hypothetical protein
MEPTIFKFQVFAGEATAAYTVRPRTFWDRLWKRVKVDFAFAFCSPEDKRDNYSPTKGINIAGERLKAFKGGRRRLQDRGYAGTAVFDYNASHWEIERWLNSEAFDVAPFKRWEARENQLKKELIASYWAFMSKRTDQTEYKIKGLKETKAELVDGFYWWGVAELKKFLRLHEEMLPHVPTFKQSLNVMRAMNEVPDGAPNEGIFPGHPAPVEHPSVSGIGSTEVI